jgi:outer membrane receptor protein involved in Fe transport
MQAASKLTITPVAAAVAAALNPGMAIGQETESGSQGALEEIVVTARKRSESAQEIPIAIQALSQDALKAMGAKAMEDYARFIPSVNVVTYSNSSSTVIFRGAITGPGYIAQSTSSVYLDEISITTTGSQPGVRLVDVERVEALSGPQGTLYGSDAQAGTMRIVTNKPDTSQFEAVLDGEVRGGDASDLSYRGSLVFNLPLVEDTLALRLVGYNDRDGGFIDNVFGHTPDTAALKGPGFYPEGFGTLDNSKSVEDRWNDSETYGGRAALRWDMTDDWAATVSIGHQTTDSGADNYYDPYVGDLQTIRFHDEFSEDKYDLYSLTVEGDLGFAQLVSATSYYDRETRYLVDVTAYAHYWTATYCHDSEYMVGDPTYYEDGTYAGPAAGWTNPDPNSGYIVWYPVYCHGTAVDGDSFNGSFLDAQQDKFTQEIRLSSQGDTLDWLVGLFYETSNDDWQSQFANATTGGDGLENVYAQSISRNFWEWYFSNYYGTPTTLPGTTSHWYSENETDWEQKAVFGEVTWHVNDQMDLTVGGRYYDRSNTNRYFVNNPGGPGNAGEPSINDPVLRAARLANNGAVPGREGVDQEFIPKISLSYSFADNKMVYGLYTRGKRPGGINRTRGVPFFPATYESDLMDNYEFGFKSMFAEGAGRFNTTVYHMAWSDYQLELVDPSSDICRDANGDPLPPDTEIPGVCGQPWQQVVTNLGEAHITGVNVELDYALGEHWVLGMNAEWMEAQTDSSHDLDGVVDEDGNTDLEVVGGLRLPLVPELKAAAWAEYHWPIQWEGQKNAYFRLQWSYTGDSLNILEPLPATDANLQINTPAYNIGDVRIGLQAETWDVSFFVNNLTDERAQYTYDTGWFEYGASNVAEGRAHVARVFTNRPREIGIHFTKSWGE